jgi:DNA-binding HxlR family transcriptional regulator
VSEIRDEADRDVLAWALDIVGDRWSLLILWEIAHGVHRFNDIQRQTGTPRGRLTQRLRRLETWAVIERRQYCDNPPRYEYGLTPAGRSLEPALAALKEWAQTYSRVARPARQHTVGRLAAASS